MKIIRLRSPLDIEILNLKIFNPLIEPEEILMKTMNPPSQDIIINIENNKVKYSSGKITKVGKIFADLPIDMKYSRLIILSYALGQIDIGIPLAAILSQERSLFLNCFNCNRVSLYNSKNANCFGKNCDFIAFYTAYKNWCLKYKKEFINSSNFDTTLKIVDEKKYEEIKKYTKENILDLHTIKEILILENELKKRLSKIGIYSKYFEFSGGESKSLNFQNDKTSFILKIILGGTFYNQNFSFSYDNLKMLKMI